MATAHAGRSDSTAAAARDAARMQVGRYLRGLAAALNLLPDAVILPDQAGVEKILAFLYRAGDHGSARADPPARLPRPRTVASWFAGTTVPNTTSGREALKALAYDLAVAHGSLPTANDVARLNRALALGDTRHPATNAATGSAEPATLRSQPTTAPVDRPTSEWTPAELGVHLPLQPEDIPPQEISTTPKSGASVASAGQTRYVPRAHDTQLRIAITEAVAIGGPHLVLMIGGSSVGKTRACYQAVTHISELAGWTLTYPEYGSDLTALLQAGVPDRTVVWLTETQRYLDDPSASQHLASLLTATDSVTLSRRVLLLGSVWPENLNRYLPTDQDKRNGTDPGPVSRVLTSPRCRDVFAAGDFTDPVSQQALAAAVVTDPVLAYAARAAGPAGQITQFLAGGPQLVDQYQRWSVGDNPADQDRAVLVRAAVDLYRAGYRRPQHEALLLRAAAGTHPQHGAPRTPKRLRRILRTALHQLADYTWKGSRTFTHTARTGQDRDWQLHDYILQTVAHQRVYQFIPGPIWQAIAAQPINTIPGTVTTTALNHGLYHLTPYLPPPTNSWAYYDSPRALHALAAGNTWAAHQLAYLLAARDDKPGLRDLAAAGNTQAANLLGYRLTKRDDETGQKKPGVGNTPAADRLASLLAKRGDVSGLRGLAATGNTLAANHLAELLAERGDEAGLRTLRNTGTTVAAADHLIDMLGPKVALQASLSYDGTHLHTS